jgi:DNA repair protein RecN (Recombination protein N)
VSLAIHDLAIIEDTTLELSEGLNVLTGETGAGKSIIIEALSLVLGDRADVELIRRGRERAEVQALFRLGANSPTKQRLAELDLADPDDAAALVIRRIVAPQGKGRAYVNGRLVTVGTLAEMSRGLVDVSSQHQHTQLLDPSTHLELLDRFGGLLPAREAFRRAYHAVEVARRQLAELKRRETERQKREEFVRFQLAELDELDPKPGEDDELEAERQRLSHADRLVSGATETANFLQAAATERLLAASRLLDRIRGFDAALEPVAVRIESARIELTDIAQDLHAYSRSIAVDPRRLDAVSERVEALRRLKKKHGFDLGGVLTARAALRQELDGFASLDIEITETERTLGTATAKATEAARALSKARRATCGELEARVSAELAQLAMTGAAIRFALTEITELSPEGFEYGELHIQTNRGEGFSPLHKTASGGELARVLLALKRALMHVDPVETCIFDEVDSGTGGAVGDLIGRKLAEIATERQVLCITHLAQIAARGDNHLKVRKEASEERTLTRVERLEGDLRVDEIARMLGGLEITKKTRAHARELVARG